MSTFGNIAKSGAVMFTVGVLLALAAPLIAGALGATLLGPTVYAEALQTPVMWTGAFFGAFGAINAAVAPVYDKIFPTKTEGMEPMTRQPMMSQEPARAPEQEVSCNFCAAEDMRRTIRAAAGRNV